MLNLLYNLTNLVLTEDQSNRPISDLEVEMSEATNIRVYHLHRTSFTMSHVVRC
jgi:hypothetical protein